MIEHPRITEVGRLLAERDRLREALVVARADIAEWVRVHHGDLGSEAVLKQIDATLAKEAGK